MAFILIQDIEIGSAPDARFDGKGPIDNRFALCGVNPLLGEKLWSRKVLIRHASQSQAQSASAVRKQIA
jgi:hypothetical protein